MCAVRNEALVKGTVPRKGIANAVCFGCGGDYFKIRFWSDGRWDAYCNCGRVWDEVQPKCLPKGVHA